MLRVRRLKYQQTTFGAVHHYETVVPHHQAHYAWLRSYGHAITQLLVQVVLRLSHLQHNKQYRVQHGEPVLNHSYGQYRLL